MENMLNSWKMWCRLCANEGPNINLFPPQYDFNKALDKFFSINISDKNDWGNMICFNCNETVKQFIDFGNKVSTVQKMFLEILNGNGELNSKELKTQYKFDKDLDQISVENTSIDTLYEPQISILTNSTDQEIGLLEISNIKMETTSDGENKIDEDLINQQNKHSYNNVIKKETSENPNDYIKISSQEKYNDNTGASRCPECKKLFSSRNCMRRHMQNLHGLTITRIIRKGPFVCQDCGKVFKTHALLEGHKIVHIEDNPFHCRQCGKSFKSKQRLKKHEDTHSTTSYICTICGLQLNTKATLNKHMVVHSDEKVHKCDYCGNVYKRAKALKTHLILHTGLKPYNCNFCNRTFANGANCRSHKKKSHPVELAAMEAAGKVSNYTKVPELKDLRALMISTKETQNDTTLN